MCMCQHTHKTPLKGGGSGKHLRLSSPDFGKYNLESLFKYPRRNRAMFVTTAAFRLLIQMLFLHVKTFI